MIAAVASFFASARSLQVGDGVAVIAVTSVAANMSSIVAGMVVFGDPLGDDFLVVTARLTAFMLVLVAAALMPAPVRAGEALNEPRAEPLATAPKPPEGSARRARSPRSRRESGCGPGRRSRRHAPARSH